MAEVPRTVDEYIAGFDVDIAQRLAAVRSAVREMVPQREERIEAIAMSARSCIRNRLIRFE